jgi:membrane protein implicated in regulation of membrane protease activity
MGLMIWAGVAMAAGVLEMLTGTFYLLVVAVAALAAAGVASFGGLAIQLAVFSLVCFVGFYWLRKRHAPTPEEPSQEIGALAQVSSISPEGVMRVKHRGSEWDADFVGEGASPEVGQLLVIRGISGIRLQCAHR